MNLTFSKINYTIISQGLSNIQIKINHTRIIYNSRKIQNIFKKIKEYVKILKMNK